jgi:IS30 family transposase
MQFIFSDLEEVNCYSATPSQSDQRWKVMKTHKQLTKEQRYQIAALKKIGCKNKEIAENIGTSEPTISREFQRNTGKRGYRPEQAHRKAMWRQKNAAKVIKMTAAVILLIEERIRFGLSPEQVSGWLKAVHGICISHERIYQHVWEDKRKGGDLYTHLRQAHKKRRKQYGSKDKRGQISNRISIEQRPKIVEEKSRIGDWEIDTVIGQNHKGALVTIVDRKSKFTLIKKVETKHADGVTATTIELLKPYSNKRFTITADNGKEFADHETIAKELETTVYFAHPYCSYERGLNENTNGLIRQYFPKGSSFEGITDVQVEEVMYRLNHRPRKGLNYQTPFEVFFEESQRKAA